MPHPLTPRELKEDNLSIYIKVGYKKVTWVAVYKKDSSRMTVSMVELNYDGHSVFARSLRGE